MNKKDLEKELSDLVHKYKDHLKDGEIADSIIGQMTCIVCVAAIRTNELDYVERDLIEIIKDNVKRAYRFMRII